MPIETTCPSCQVKLVVREESLSDPLCCPRCSTVFGYAQPVAVDIPMAEAVPEPAVSRSSIGEPLPQTYPDTPGPRKKQARGWPLGLIVTLVASVAIVLGVSLFLMIQAWDEIAASEQQLQGTRERARQNWEIQQGRFPIVDPNSQRPRGPIVAPFNPNTPPRSPVVPVRPGGPRR